MMDIDGLFERLKILKHITHGAFKATPDSQQGSLLFEIYRELDDIIFAYKEGKKNEQ